MKKTFDAVAYQRKARAGLGRRYLDSREHLLDELAEARETFQRRRSKGKSVRPAA